MDEEKAAAITDIKMGPYKKYENSVGDTWDPAWAEDDQLYFPGNDGSGWDAACRSNLFFNRAAGEDYMNLKGETVSGMSEYGGWAVAGLDECTWKSGGCISVDGTLYLSIARHRYGRLPGDPHGRQIAERASIIKSTDKGKTWSRTEKENYEKAMFVSQRFATPYFIHYGKDGAAPAVDNADMYIYATSNNGYWCNGDNYILGRVLRSKIGRLDASDWTYYTGMDGIKDENWSKDMNKALPIIENPLKCGETGPTYISSIGRYVLVAWSYPGDPNIDTDKTHFIFYESPKPWGPWTRVKEEVIWPEGWYCPRVLNKWLCHKDNEVTGVLVTGGDYWQGEYYKFTVVPVQFKVGGSYPQPVAEPVPLVVNDGEIGEELNQFRYHGAWGHEKARIRAFQRDEHYSSEEDDFFTVKFFGTGIRWYGSKDASAGIAAVSLDGNPEVEVDLHTHSPSTQFGRILFDSGKLSRGIHTFKVRVTGRKNEYAKAARVWCDRVEIIEE